MTQEFVTLPSEVVEQALKALFMYKPMVTGVTFQYGLDAMQALHAALEQPQECYDQRDPLADQQIDAIAESMPGGLDGFLKGWGWRQFARAVLEAAPQPPTTEQSSAVVEECLTDELKPRFSAHDDAERLKSVARGMSYNDHGEAVWKHTLMEIAVRLESGGYAAPQPPALEQQVEQESTCKDSLQVEQAAVAWLATYTGKVGEPLVYVTSSYELAVENDRNQSPKPLYLHQQNLNCKSNQKRLATLWGYVKAEQPQVQQEPSPVAPGCKATKRGDHVVCDDCKSAWDANDKNPQACVPAPPAVDKPQANQPAMTPIAQRKLDSLLAEGYTISGYSVYHDRKHQHGFVTGAGLVGWWKPEGVEYPQPLGEQEPVAWMVASEMQDGTRSTYPMIGRFKDVQDCCDFGEPVPLIYQHPQPKREPLTDERIDAIADAMPGGLEGFMKGWGWRQFARAVLEATNNIK